MKNSVVAPVEMFDRELAELVLKGNEQAFEEIINRYYKRLFQTALVILQDHSAAEKVTQQTFQQARQTLNQFQGQSLLIAWLSRMLIELAHKKRSQMI
jgi:RNA polymerase sigma-70 factor (ECF subfamily)